MYFLQNVTELVIGLSFIKRPILGDHLKAHKFGFSGFHEKRCSFHEKCCSLRVKSVAVFVKSVVVFVKSVAFRKTSCKEL